MPVDTLPGVETFPLESIVAVAAGVWISDPPLPVTSAVDVSAPAVCVTVPLPAGVPQFAFPFAAMPVAY
jgi:hypothetical protein